MSTQGSQPPRPDGPEAEPTGQRPEPQETSAPGEIPPACSADTAASPSPQEPGAEPTLQPQLPEDLRAPWTWTDLFIFVFFALGSAVVMSQVVAVTMLVMFRATPDALNRLPLKAVFAALHQAATSGVLLLYLFAMLRVRFNAPFWRTLGWRELRLPGVGRLQGYVACVLGGCLVAIFVNFASVLVRTETKLPIEELFKSRESILLLMGAGILVAPLVEETIFRGFLYPLLARSLGLAGGVIVTGMLFGLMHALQLWGGWGQIVLLMIVGIVFTWVRARTGTVLAPYLLHLGYNSFLFAVFYVLTDGFRNLPPAP